MEFIDVVQTLFVDWWTWTIMIFETISRTWLVGGVVLSMVLGYLAARAVAAGSMVWELGIMLVLAAGLCLILLAATQIEPTFFSPDALARSQAIQTGI